MRALGLFALLSLPAAAATLVVRPGQSIQAAVDRARPGDTVLVLAGTYREAGRPCPEGLSGTCAVAVTKDGATLVGFGAVLRAQPGQSIGIAFAKPGVKGKACLDDASQRLHGATVRGFTVRGFQEDGIHLRCADGILVEGNTAAGNREYGIFPSHVVGGRVTGNTATGANDTGIYIGQSRGVRVDHNVARDNVSGFEVENSTGITVDHNLAMGNTAGFLSFTLPGLDIPLNDANTIEENVSIFNNRDNTCSDPSDTVCRVPSGTGILEVAVDRNVVRNNVVVGNASLGIALSDFCTAESVPAPQCTPDFLGIDPLPDDNRTVGNIVLGNGGFPDTLRLPPGVAGDLVWTGVGSGNCWSRNLARTVFSPVALPSCP